MHAAREVLPQARLELGCRPTGVKRFEVTRAQRLANVAIRRENERAGTTDWLLDRIQPVEAAGADAAFRRRPAVEGFCSRTSLRPGERGYYLVQDIEECYCTTAEQTQAALASYRFGLRPITEGTWVRDQLKQRFGRESVFVGIGVDYGVHLVHRYQERGDATRATAELAPVILVAAAITMLGYGTLVTSSYPPLQSMGLVSVVSTIALAAASVFTLPALLVGKREKGVRPLFP